MYRSFVVLSSLEVKRFLNRPGALGASCIRSGKWMLQFMTWLHEQWQVGY